MKYKRRNTMADELLAQFPEKNPNPVFLISDEAELLYANLSAESLLMELDLLAEDKIHINDETFKLLTRSIKKNQAIDLTLGAQYYHVVSTRLPEKSASFLFLQEVTLQKEYESLLYLTESVIENTIEGIFITDADGVIERVNPAFTKITAYSPLEAIGKTPRIFKSNRQSEEFYQKMWHDLKEKGYWEGEIWNRRKDGMAIPVWQSITAIRNTQYGIEKFVSVFHDISDIKSSQKKLVYQAYHDVLTRLPNRQLFIDRLQQAIASSKRNNSKVAVLLLDIDNFKKVNDSLGHHLGDKYLQIIAERLRVSCREEDTIARLGGDEFALITLYLNSQNDVIDILERVQETIATPLLIENHELVPQASIGVTFYPDDGENPQTLLQNADLAMYKAKRSSSDKYALFNPSLQESAQLRIQLETNMRRALQTDEFMMYYQPKVEPHSRKVCGVEALVRWKREGMVISPADFIPVAEETGLIFPLGRQITTLACRDIAEMHKRGYPDISLAVNVSGKQFQDASLANQIHNIINETEFSPNKLNIEITENVAVTDINSALHMLEQFSTRGISTSIDDFGTGYSSLAYIKRFNADILKIDKSFIDDLPDDPGNRAIVQAIVSMSHAVGMKVVAEGVETKEQVEYLMSVGCDLIQGYYYSKPLQLDELISRIGNDYTLKT